MKQLVGFSVPVGYLWVAFAAVFYLPTHAQTYVVKDSPYIKGTTVVIPGKEYKRSGYHNFFWGEHFRKEWSTAFRVKDINLDTVAGGLTPIKEGGGRQSKSLRLKNNKDKEYVLRSVNKDFGRGLPDGMKGTFMSGIAKDQVSIGHPYAAITITPMARATGIYHTTPQIVFVPKQPALKDFSDEYGDQLYLLEERPDEDQGDAANFGNAKNVIGSDKLSEKMYDDNDNNVDHYSFVRARLFDMFIGDWGRHPDNWRWAQFDSADQTVYKPVPRDRDQAYTKIDGFYPDLAGSLPGLRHLQGFGYSIKKVGAWNFPGRPLDNMFLNELTLSEWQQEAVALQKVLTDSLIESSIRRMPPELFAISGEKIIAKLKSRRDQLQDFATDYYLYLAKQVRILGSNKKERIQLTILPDKKVSVSVHKINKDGVLADSPYYSRTFSEKETKELLIYSLDKKDVVSIAGESKTGINVHIMDPQDKDSIVMEGGRRKTRGINFYRGSKFEYDTLWHKHTKIYFIPIFTPSTYHAFDADPLDLFPRTGIKISAGVSYISQPWRKKEYQFVHSLNASYGFIRGSFNIGYTSRFGKLIGKWDFLVKGRLDLPAVENYFGIGNNTKNLVKNRNAYRTLSNRTYAAVGIERNIEKKHHTEISLFYQSVRYQKIISPFFNSLPKIDPAFFTRKHFAGIEAGYYFDQTNGSLYPSKGFAFNVTGGVIQHLADTGTAIVKMGSIFSVFLPLSKKFTLAQRVGGAIIIGEPAFYHLNRLGGNAEQRGFERERFYGKDIFYSNTELRWLTNTRNYFFNGRAGLLAFYDVGRVWMPREISTKWHKGYGGGIVLIPYNKITLTAMYGVSSEGDNLFFRAQLFF